MMTQAGLKRLGPGSAFTLLELLLTTALLLALLGAVVFSFSSLQRGAKLEEGVAQFESLLRFARAHAANTGRQVQISFEEDVGDGISAPLGNLRVLWEPDPLGQPGQFQVLPEAASYVRAVTELVSVELVLNELSDDPPVQEPADDASPAALSFLPVTFFPDGSSDSAEIVLASRGNEDERLMSVRLVGVTGFIRRRIVTRGEKSGEIKNPEPDDQTIAEASR